LLGRTPRLATFVSTLFTFSFVAFCFTIFRCADIQTAIEFFSAKARLGRAEPVSLDLWLLVALLGAVHFVIAEKRTWIREKIHAIPDRAFYPALGAAAALFLYFTPLSNEAFIYFQF
jgi:hypothetical protein